MQTIKFASVTDPTVGLSFETNVGGWLFSLQGGNDKKVYILKLNSV